MKIIKEKELKEYYNFTKVDSYQFFDELNKIKTAKIVILQVNSKEPAFSKLKNVSMEVIMDGLSFNHGDCEFLMRKGKFSIDMTNPRSKIYRYDSDTWYCEVMV